MVSDYTIKTYLNSQEGEELTRQFTFTPQDRHERKVVMLSIDYSNFGGDRVVLPYGKAALEDQFEIMLRTLDEILDEHNLRSVESDAELFGGIINNIVLWDWKLHRGKYVKDKLTKRKRDSRNNPALIPILSLLLHAIYPERTFYPVLFNKHFSTFIKMCNVLGIQLPDSPLQKDKEERCWYYMLLTEKLYKFAVEHNLSKPEMCSLLYGFAANEVEEMEKQEAAEQANTPESDLPAPSRIWLTAVSKADVELGRVDKKTSILTCNEQTKRGDIVIVYETTPYSKIHSIWRAINDGTVNPFEYYCNWIEVGHRIDVPGVTFKELKEDPYMSNVPIVRRRLSGINGIELTIEDYKNLQRMFAEKGFDSSVLPQIEVPELNLDR